MKIINIKRTKKHSAVLEFDTGFNLEADITAIEESHIHKDDELSEEDIENLKNFSEYQKAKSRALWLIDYAEQTERGLLEKLERAGFDEQIAKKAIDRLKESDIINDKRFAERYAQRCADNRVSYKQTYMKLIAKKIDRETAKNAVSSVEFNDPAAIEYYITKKYYQKLISNDVKEIRKAFDGLVRKGFSYPDIKAAIEKFSSEISSEEEFY